MKTKIIFGAPCSGKTIYIKDHVGENDIVLSYDDLMAALNLKAIHKKNDNIHGYVIGIRDDLIEKLKSDTKIDTAYIVTCRVSEKMKANVADLSPEYILMDKTREEVYAQMEADETREDRAYWRGLIDDWFAWYDEHKADFATAGNGGSAAMGKAPCVPAATTAIMAAVNTPSATSTDGETGVYGYIVDDDDAALYRAFGYRVTSPKDIHAVLKSAKGAPITVGINSPGGDLWAGSEIYTALREYTGAVTAKIFGIAASSASVIAMAADTVLISPTGEMMIHNPWSSAQGDYRALEQAVESLRVARDVIVNAYRLKTKKSEEELQALMNAGSGDYSGTWMDAKAAVKHGFADKILYDDDGILSASAPAPTGSLAAIAAACGKDFPSAAELCRRAGLSAQPEPASPNEPNAETELLRARAKMLSLL